MKGYKSSENRLVKLFKEGREKWKQRALSKQKKLRAMDIKVRDISFFFYNKDYSKNLNNNG